MHKVTNFFNFVAVGQSIIHITYHERHFEFFTDYFFHSFFGFNDTASTGLLNNVFLLLLTAMNKMIEEEIQGSLHSVSFENVFP
jgi:hypothetical protein